MKGAIERMDERTLLFTDVVDSTAIVSRLGDRAAATLWDGHDRAARELLARHGGLEIDRSDGFFLLFDDTAAAAGFAIGYHAAMAGLGLAARVGIHRGPVTLRKSPPEAVARGAKPLEVDGVAKPLAARVMSLATGGQTLLSASAAEACRQDLPPGRVLHAHGHYRLKGIEHPVSLFELGDGHGAGMPPADVDKAYRVVADGELWKPVREIRHNLAPERDAFVGRAAELRRLASTLEEGARLVSVLGPGGTGKTRLVRRYARAWLGDWPGGVYFCDLSDARSIDGIHFAVALALEVTLGREEPGSQLGHAMAGRGRCLVVLDNFEQVAEHAAATVGRWLDQAAQAAFLVTSRELLRLDGEVAFAVEPLLAGDEALELFAVRARAQRPDFRLEGTVRDDVARVVRWLDGLPLAIELAAARVRVLSVRQILERLGDRFQLLTGARGAHARQATLRAAIDWSWDLLAPWEQSALAQCSVFEGGFTLEAVEAVIDVSAWPHGAPIVDIVQSLVDKSLLRARVPKAGRRFEIDEPYFGMYLSIQQYGAEKLARDGGQTAAEARHGRHYARFGTDEALRALTGPGGSTRRHELTLELDNLVGACRRAITRGDGPVGVAAFQAACEVFALQGPAAPAIALGAQLLSMASLDPSMRARATFALGSLELNSGKLAAARASFEQAAAAARSIGDRGLEGRALGQLGAAHRELGEPVAARPCLEEALAIAREAGDRVAEASVLGGLASLHLGAGDVGTALRDYERALAIHRAVGNLHNEAITLGNLATAHQQTGEFERSLAEYRRVLEIRRETGDRRGTGVTLGNMGNLYIELGRLDEALPCQEEALAIHRDAGNRAMEAAVLGNLGILHRWQGASDRAIECCEAAIEIARAIGRRMVEGYFLGVLGELHAEAGRHSLARACCEQGLALVRAGGARRLEGILCGHLGDALGRQGLIDDARAALARGQALLGDVGDRHESAKLRCTAGLLEFRAGDVEAARQMLAEAETAARDIGVSTGSELSRRIDALRHALVPGG